MKHLVKSEEEITGMRVAGKLAAEVLDFISPYIKPGISTEEIDRLCHAYIVTVQSTIPAPLNYCPPGHTPYPKATCISVNDVVCHGIPDGRILVEGDVVNVDVTVIKGGFHGDNSRMFHVGKVSDEARRLSETAFECMWRGIAEVRPGAHLGDIGYVIQQHAEAAGYSVVREVGGHGIGRKFHEPPFIAHYGVRGTKDTLSAGMTFTIEPMLNAGARDIQCMADGWTIKTRDGSLSAQWEHTVLVTETGYEVLTRSQGTQSPPFGLPFATPEQCAALAV